MYDCILCYGSDRGRYWYGTEADGIIFLTVREAEHDERLKIFAEKRVF